jgi:hypothetical protein
MVTEILNILLPIYGCVGLGFVLGRFGFPWDAKMISPLVLQVSLPLLVIHQFTRSEVTSGSIIWMILAAVLVVGLFVVVFGVLLRVAGLSVRTYLAAACFSNMAIGFALGYLGFGNSGFAMSLAFGAVMLLAQFTLGKWFPSGKIQMKLVFRQVFLYALVLGMVLMFGGISLPSYVERGLHLVGQITIPLLLLSLGFALAKVSLAGFGKGMLLATARLLICLCIGMGVSWVLSLQGEERKLVILLSMLPSSTINILMGQEAEVDLEPLTIFVTCTNFWLIVSLPVALAVLL